MRTLAASDVVRLWEMGLVQPHPLDRAVNILAAAYSSLSREELLHLSIGERDRLLLDVREAWFGSQLDCFAACPACGEKLEFSVHVDDLRTAPALEANTPGRLKVDDYELTFRLPNSLDLAAAAALHDVHAVRALLLSRCVSEARWQGNIISPDALPPAAIDGLMQAMTERDPQADMRLDLECPACGAHWMLAFDILNYLWRELSAQARRLLHDVHTLALAYGWREADILALSSMRRQFYLDLVRARG